MLQRVDNLTDRQAAEAVATDLTWKYALGLSLDDPGFDAGVLNEFRSRLIAHELEEKPLDLLLAALQERGLPAAGGRQRTDSTHVISAVRDVNRVELAGECVRAAMGGAGGGRARLGAAGAGGAGGARLGRTLRTTG